MYTRRKKDTTSEPPPIVSLDPGNNLVHFEVDDSLPIALHKDKRSCTYHLISNFVSLK